MPVAPTSPIELLDLIRKSGVASPERLAAVDATALPPEPRKAAAVLIQKKLITKFQAEQLLAGRHRGFRLGAYAVLDQLGRGGMGAVYLADHVELHRKVAIKVLVSGKDEDQKLAVERFLREARAAAALDHPNIVRIFDVCRHGDVPYLVMEYVEGHTLQQILDRDGTVPYTTAADYIAQAASGLQHAHEKGFVHRDIKPGNIIRDKSGTVKILDMGLARCSDSDRDKITEQLDAGAVVGTADFIAPEQALNNAPIDIRADIYSLGATFFTMIIGKPPFEGNTAQKLLQHQMTAAPHLSTLDATLPKGLVGVVARMLAKKPDDRFQTPADVIGALAPWLGNSSRIMAGLSHTKLGQGAELHATLNELAMRSSTRLGVAQLDRETADGHDSGEVNPGSPTSETSEIAGAETTRDPVKKRKNAAPSKSKQFALYAAGVVLIVCAGVAAAVAFGGKADPPKTTPDPDTAKGTNAPVVPTPEPKNEPQPVPKPKNDPTTKVQPAEPILFHFEANGMPAFAIRSGLQLNGATPPQKVAKPISKTGGEPPPGWQARCWNTDSQMEFFADEAKQSFALGIRNASGPPSAMLFSPAFTCPSGMCRLKFEYLTAVRDKKFTVKFKTNDNRQAWVIATPSPTGDVWRGEDLIVDLKGATGGLFEFHTSEDVGDTAIRIRSLIVTQLPASAASPPQPTAPDYAKWNEAAVVYRFDIAAIAPFRVTKEGGTVKAGQQSPFPAGIYGRCWKSTATGEFRREEIEGSPALGSTNFSEEMSAQYAFELEKDLKVILKPGSIYRVKLSYLTKNEAVGGLVVQSQDYKGVASTKLANTANQWKPVAIHFERKDGVPVRITLDNTSVGEGNTLYFRSLEVIELDKPAMK